MSQCTELTQGCETTGDRLELMQPTHASNMKLRPYPFTKLGVRWLDNGVVELAEDDSPGHPADTTLTLGSRSYFGPDIGRMRRL